jgi:hypothetical protein
MPTGTQSTTLMTRPPRAIVEGPTTVPFVQVGITNTSQGATASGATLVRLCRIPVGATITDVQAIVVTGAATAPMDIGITGTGTYLGAAANGNASTFASAGTGAAIVRATRGLPWRVTASDDATTRFSILTATVTPGTATLSFVLQGSVTYTLGEP